MRNPMLKRIPTIKATRAWTAEIVIHTVLDIIGDSERLFAVLRRYNKMTETAEQTLIIKHYEDHIQQHDKPVEHSTLSMS